MNLTGLDFVGILSSISRTGWANYGPHELMFRPPPVIMFIYL